MEKKNYDEEIPKTCLLRFMSGEEIICSISQNDLKSYENGTFSGTLDVTNPEGVGINPSGGEYQLVFYPLSGVLCPDKVVTIKVLWNAVVYITTDVPSDVFDMYQTRVAKNRLGMQLHVSSADKEMILDGKKVTLQ